MLPETWTPEYRKNVQQEIEKYKNDLKKSQYIKPSISCPNGHHYSKFTCEKKTCRPLHVGFVAKLN